MFSFFKLQSRNANELQHQNSQEENSSSVKNDANSNSDRVWLVHRGGFCAAVRLPQTKAHLDNHKVVIKLLHNGEEMTVDEDDVEKQNSSSLDLVEDICELKHLNEASVLHCLRQRFASNLIHTKAGPTLLVVNPMAPLSLYSEKVFIFIHLSCYCWSLSKKRIYIFPIGCVNVSWMQDRRYASAHIFIGSNRLQINA